jgi:hypothetical protein
MTTVNDRRFYVYAYLRADGTPYYIGKGTGRRAWRHNKADRIQAPADHGRIALLKEQLTSQEACEVEVQLIEQYGRKSQGGTLVNWTAGGDGLSEPDDEVRRKMSEWERTPEMRSKMAATKGAHLEEEAAQYGVPVAEYKALTRKTRYLVKTFVRRHPEVDFQAALQMGGRGRTLYAAGTAQALAKRSASRAVSGAIDKAADATRDLAPKRRWQHQAHGTVTCAAWELVAMFPEQELTRSNLSKVANGKRKRCKGWELAA